MSEIEIYKSTNQYLMSAIREIRKLPCKCSKDNVLDCDRCSYMEDIISIHSSIREEIENLK